MKTRNLCLVLSIFAAACTSAVASTPAPQGSVDADAGNGGAKDAKPPETDGNQGDPACDALRGNLATALETERAAQKVNHAALGVYIAPCGTIALAASSSTAVPAATPDTLFRIASISKTFLAATIIQLAQAKELDLDAPIGTWFPELPKANLVTLKMLLNHTSGIPDYLGTSNYRDATKDRIRTPSVDERISWVKDLPFTHEPGAKWEYSNTNYLIAGRIVDKATGKGWAAQIRANAFEKAHLDHTFVFGEEAVSGTIALGPDAHELEWIGADGAVVTTAADLVTWIRALYMDRTVLDAPGFTLMDTTVPIQKGLSYGLGMLRFEPSITGGVGTMRGHDGAVLGYRATAFSYPDKGWAIAAFLAKEGAKPDKVQLAAEAILAAFTP